jgi:hypothetical protein
MRGDKAENLMPVGLAPPPVNAESHYVAHLHNRQHRPQWAGRLIAAHGEARGLSLLSRAEKVIP